MAGDSFLLFFTGKLRLEEIKRLWAESEAQYQVEEHLDRDSFEALSLSLSQPMILWAESEAQCQVEEHLDRDSFEALSLSITLSLSL